MTHRYAIFNTALGDQGWFNDKIYRTRLHARIERSRSGICKTFLKVKRVEFRWTVTYN